MIISTSIHIAANGIILFFLQLSAILLCVCASSSLSFICWWTFRLLPHLSCSSPEFLKAYILFLSLPSTPRLCNRALGQNFPCNHFWFKSQRFQFSPVQSLSHVWLSVTPWIQHTRLPSPSPTPRACSNSCPSSQWCHPTISSSVVPFSPCPKSFPVSGSFPMSQFFASGGQSIGASASASVLPMNIQDWFPLGWTGLITLQFKWLSRVFSNTTHLKIISGGKSCTILKCIQTSLVVQWSELCLQSRGHGFHPWLEN